MATSQRSRPRTNLSLGGEQAEADPLLELGFYESADFVAVESRIDPRCFVIGRTGSGKSAILQRLEEVHSEHVIRINPEDLSLPYITDLGVIRFLTSLDVHLDPFFIALWKHVLLVELIRHRYKVDTPQAKKSFFESLRDRVQRDKSKQAALDYFDEFAEKFWCETDERVKEITSKLENSINSAASVDGKAGPVQLAAGKDRAESTSVEVRSQQAERFQRVVNETQLPRLNKMMSVLDEDILESRQNFTYVVIDDLDRDWVDERLANDLVRCLFRAVIDLQRVRNLKVIVALRTNIFEQLNFGSRSGGQEEKFRSLALNVRWSERDLELMLDERTKAASELFDFPGVTNVKALLPRTNKTRGDALHFITQRTLMRPRDAIAYMNEALRDSRRGTRLSWERLHEAEQPYSHKRLLALRDEWKPTYPDIDKVLYCFRRSTTPLTAEELRLILDEAILLLADPSFAGVTWMTKISEPVWSGHGESWADSYHELVRLLFRLGFLGVVSDRGAGVVFSDQD